MNKEIEEYKALREEINQLCAAMDNIVGILYAFLAAYLAYFFQKEDTIYLLLSYIAILPAYLIIINKRIASCKISAYIAVFYEGEGNKWETRLTNYKTPKKLKVFNYIDAYHFPAIFSDIAIWTLYMLKTKWQPSLSLYEIGKLVAVIIFSISVIVIAIKSRKICVKDYIGTWESILQDENTQTTTL